MTEGPRPGVEEFPFGAFVVEAAFLGETTAFALGDGTVRLVERGSTVVRAAHSGAILAAARSHDGALLVTAGDDGRIAATAAAGPKILAERPRRWLDQLAAGPGSTIAFGDGREAVVLFADGRQRTFAHERAVTGLAFAPKGLRLAVARYNGVTLWWPSTEAAPTTLEWKGAHAAVTFSPDGRYVVTAMQENALHGWRLSDTQHLRMSGYPAKPRSLSWSPRGRFLATSGAEMAVLWPFHTKDGPQGREPLQLGARHSLVTRVACHPRDEVVAIGYQDGAIGLARFLDGRTIRLRDPDGSPVSTLAWDRAGRRLAAGTEAGTALLVALI